MFNVMLFHFSLNEISLSKYMFLMLIKINVIINCIFQHRHYLHLSCSIRQIIYNASSKCGNEMLIANI